MSISTHRYESLFDAHGQRAPHVLPEHDPKPPIVAQPQLEDVLIARIAAANAFVDAQDVSLEAAHRCQQHYDAVAALRDLVGPEATQLLTLIVRSRYGRRRAQPHT